MKVTAEILRCPHGTTGIAVGGVRITTGEHCGRWDTVARVKIDTDNAIAAFADAKIDADIDERAIHLPARYAND